MQKIALGAALALITLFALAASSDTASAGAWGITATRSAAQATIAEPARWWGHRRHHRRCWFGPYGIRCW